MTDIKPNTEHEIEITWGTGLYNKRHISIYKNDFSTVLYDRYWDSSWCTWEKYSSNEWVQTNGSSCNKQASIRDRTAVYQYAEKLNKAYEELITAIAIEEIVLNE